MRTLAYPMRQPAITLSPPATQHRRDGGLWANLKLGTSTYCLTVHPLVNSTVLGHPASPQALAGTLPSIWLNAFLGNVGRNIANSLELSDFNSKFSKRLLNILQKRELTGVFSDLTPHENLGNRSTWGYLCAVWNEQWQHGLFGQATTQSKRHTHVIKDPPLKRLTQALVDFTPTRWLLNVIMFYLPGNAKVGLKADSYIAQGLGYIPFVGGFLKEKTLVLARMKGLYFKTRHDPQVLINVKAGKQVQAVLPNGTPVWESIYQQVPQTDRSSHEKATALRYGLSQLLKLSPDKGVGVWVQRFNHANAPLTNTLWDAAQTGNFWQGLGAGATHYTNWLAYLAGGKLLGMGGDTVLAQVLPEGVNPHVAKWVTQAWQQAGLPIVQASLPNLVQKPLFLASARGASVDFAVLQPPPKKQDLVPTSSSTYP